MDWASPLQRLVLNAYGNDPDQLDRRLAVGRLAQRVFAPAGHHRHFPARGVHLSIEMTTAPGLTYQA